MVHGRIADKKPKNLRAQYTQMWAPSYRARSIIPLFRSKEYLVLASFRRLLNLKAVTTMWRERG
jgi:hypothetical protein